METKLLKIERYDGNTYQLFHNVESGDYDVYENNELIYTTTSVIAASEYFNNLKY
jgi:hypothetical protein